MSSPRPTRRRLLGARVEDFQADARIDEGIGAAHPHDPPAVVGVPHRPVLAAEELEHRLRTDIAALLDPMKPRHRCVLADPGQFRRDGVDRPVLDRRRGRKPGRQPRRQTGFGDADLAGFRV